MASAKPPSSGDACPQCGSPGRPISHVVSAPMLYGGGSASAQAETIWACPACGVGWDTIETHQQPHTRQVTQIRPRTYAFAGPAYYYGGPVSPLSLSQEEDDADIPVIQGSVIGYRAWRIKDWQLHGTGVNRAWVPGVNEATCDPGESEPYGGITFAFLTQSGQHKAPGAHCHCGITALARFAQHDTHWSGVDVYGAIEAWSDDSEDGDGRFILHGTGFRAQYAKVVLLAVDPDWPAPKLAAIRALAREHSADVCKRSHLEDAAKEHGQLVPDDMLAWAAEGDPGTVEGTFQVATTKLMQAVQQSALSMAQLSDALKTKPPAKGVKQTLGYPGPPSHGKFRRDDRVRDCKGETWECVRGGKPGSWTKEES